MDVCSWAVGFGGRAAIYSPLGIQASEDFFTVSVAASVLALGIEIHLAEGAEAWRIMHKRFYYLFFTLILVGIIQSQGYQAARQAEKCPPEYPETKEIEILVNNRSFCLVWAVAELMLGAVYHLYLYQKPSNILRSEGLFHGLQS